MTRPPPERVIWSARPGIAFIIIRRLGAYASVLLLAGVFWWLSSRLGGPSWTQAVPLALAASGGFVLIYSILDWMTRRYTLTDRRAVATFGVLRRYTVDAPLSNVQNLNVYRSIRERLTGLGSVGLATASGAEVWWTMIARPDEALDRARRAIAQPETPAVHTDGRSESLPAQAAAPVVHPAVSEPSRVLVIGLAGGIGAGKSAVASAFGELGCLVVDSDREAKAALDRPEVRDELVKWWGAGILSAEGRVDRAKVAQIVFADAAQRSKLEGLVHPIVRATREQMKARAAAAEPPSPKAVIVDAPLLFEAGVDTECDAVVFVDAPRALRLDRVIRTRGWTAQELDRREAAQMPLEEKRRRSRFVIVNDGDAARLKEAAAGVLKDLESGGTHSPSPLHRG